MQQGTLILIIVIETIIIYFLFKKLRNLKFQKKSYEVKTGKWTEDYFPFLKDYPVDYKTGRFLGEPIDVVAFADDGVFFIEHKTGFAQLSEKQKRIKEVVENKKVYWREVRVR